MLHFSVEQRPDSLSPLRYPGGKSWLVPFVRHTLLRRDRKPSVFVEPFAGGASVGLAVAEQNLARSVVLIEQDKRVAAFWRTIIYGDAERLARAITSFQFSDDAVLDILSRSPRSDHGIAFQFLLRNRVSRGGIVSKTSGLLKSGERGRGLRSRWYPGTLASRIRQIATLRDRLVFIEGDGTKLFRDYARRGSAFIFVDPPYTSCPDDVGSRLYDQSHIDHDELWARSGKAAASVLLTYNDTALVRAAARRHHLYLQRAAMRTTHHQIQHELILSNRRVL
jgi:DNA adenine methylase